MLLNSLYFAVLLLTLLTYKLNILLYIFIIVLIANIIKTPNIFPKIKRLKFLLFFIATTCLFQIFYNSYGKVLVDFGYIKIYSQGIQMGSMAVLKILDMALCAWIMDFEKIFSGKFLRYKKIITVVVQNVPIVFSLYKKRKKIDDVFQILLKKVYKEL